MFSFLIAASTKFKQISQHMFEYAHMQNVINIYPRVRVIEHCTYGRRKLFLKEFIEPR